MAKKLGRAMRGGAGQIPTPAPIDKHVLQEARAAARAKADELFKAEMAKITGPLDERLELLKAERERLDTELRNVEHEIVAVTKARNEVLGISEKAPVRSRAGGEGGTRTRLTAEKLTEIAKSLATWIGHQKDEVSGAQIKEYLASMHGYKVQAPMAFLDKYAAGHGVKTTGAKAAMRYHK